MARTFSADTKAKTLVMTQQIETAMQGEIQQLDWMSPATKQEAHAQAACDPQQDRLSGHMARLLRAQREARRLLRRRQHVPISFEDAREWHKLGKPVDLNEWGMTPPTVNAYFNPQMNDINFPGGRAAGAALRPEAGRRAELRQHGRDDRS